jgi:HEPN domain-containing protein
MNEALVKEWMRHAEEDLFSANILFNNPARQIAGVCCFLAQQCAEKALKAFIVFHGEEPKKTHDLLLLCEKCAVYDDSFSQLFDSCDDLQSFAVEIRYPNALNAKGNTAERAIKDAQKIYDFCKERIQ